MPLFDKKIMERTLSIVTLALFQCIIVFTPVLVIPMLLITALSPFVMFNEHPENRIVFFSQLIFLAGCFLPKKAFRIPTKALGFIGMVIAYITLVKSGDAGGEIGARNNQGIFITVATGIPFIIAGIAALAVSLLKKEESSQPVVATP